MTERNFHDKYYKALLLIPLTILILSIISLGMFYSQNGDFIRKDISLTGGTSVTIYDQIDMTKLKEDLSEKLEDISTRAISDLVTGEQKAIIIETKAEGDITREVLEEYLGYKLNSENSSFEFTGSALSESFYNQLLVAILIAFIFMGIVVFIIFRTAVPSSAVILSAFADIVMTLALFNLLGMKMSTAGIVAFLMLIGYSVDTNILLSTKVLKRGEGSIFERIVGAAKTGLMLSLTTLTALAVALIFAQSLVLKQIVTILFIGLVVDIMNTWIQNAGIIRLYLERKRKE